MENKEKESEKNDENNESNNKESTNIEPIETIQSSFKGNSNYGKIKNYQSNHHKPNHFNNHNNHTYYPNNFANQNTISKNRKASLKIYNDTRYNNPNYIKNIDAKNKIYSGYKKKRIPEMNNNNDHNNSQINDNKLIFINPYKEAEDFTNYDKEFSKFNNLNFLKQSWKQKRFPEEDNNDILTNLNTKVLGNSQNLSINNMNYSSLLKPNYNQAINSFNLGNNQMTNFLYMMNLINSKQNMNNIPNNIVNQNSNNLMINTMMNFPINSMNLNNNNNLNNMANMNSSKMNSVNNLNPLNINNMIMMYNQLNNNKFKNMNKNMNHPIQNTQLSSGSNQNIENSKNKSPQKLNNNNKNNIYNNLPNQISNSFNSLLQFYFSTLQYQQIILNKMTQLLSPNNNINIHSDIQEVITQLNAMLNNEINQLSPILSQNINTNISKGKNNNVKENNIPNNNIDNNINNNSSINNYKGPEENKENINTLNENENNDKYIQNILSTWPKQEFVKPYSPLLKLDKNNSSLKSTNFIYNQLNSNNTLNINTMSFSNLNGVNLTQNYMLNDQEYNKQVDNNYNNQKIEELLKIGKCLKGVIRMNKSQNHGYITVPGINNDILVRGKNLYECLNLDEVVVELFNFSQWKNLANKKTKKFSHVNEEGLLNNVTNNLYNEENKSINIKSLDDEENNIKTKEERVKLINEQLYHLRPEGRIIKIIKSPNKEREQICVIQIEKNKIYGIPIDDTIPKILINLRNLTKKIIPNIENMSFKLNMPYFPNELEKDYKNFEKKYFSVKIYSFASSNLYKGPLGYIINEIGQAGNIDVETEVLLKNYKINYTDKFSEEIMNEVKNSLEEIKITDEYIKNTKRKDFRNELVFTIDPYTSKDLDDAIHVKIIDEKTQLLEIGVHIADPTTYVKENSLLDKEALNRATSVYLVQKKISMLPLILSDDVCSIMPKKDTLTISCIFRIYLSGKLDQDFQPYFCLSVVNSRAKWDYDLVQKIIDKKEVNYNDLKFEDGTKPDSEQIFEQLKKSVEILYQLTKLVRKERFDSGSLQIDNDDIYFDLDEYSQPKDFHISVKNESHNLIEELMLISNLLCAKYIYKNLKEYSLIRRHPFFNDNKFNEIQRYFSLNKMNPDFDDPAEINKLLTKIKKNNYNKYLCIQHKLKFFVLRAEYVFAGNYSLDELKHSSLNLELYTHFSSPIRRYPDMIVHRQLKEIFKLNNKEIDQKDFHKFEKYFPFIEHINDRYNSARLISQKSKRLFQYIYLKTATKKLYTALIMDIISKSNNKKGTTNPYTINLMNNYVNIENNTNNNEEDDFYLILFVPELNLELEWRKPDNEEIVLYKYDKAKNELYIDYMIDKECKNKYLRCFDALQVELISVDSIPIDIKCKIDLTK